MKGRKKKSKIFLKERVEISAKRFRGIGRILLHFFPFLKLHLKQAEIKTPAEIYILVALLNSLISFCFLFIPLLFILFFTNSLTADNVFIVFLLSSSLGLIRFFNFLLKPKAIVSRKIMEIEKNILFAMRHLLIELKSGVPLFNGIVSVSQGNYGVVSEEFKRVVKETNAGTPLITALDRMAARNPSTYLRRMVWQLTNALRAGSDVTVSIEEIVKNLAEEQKISVRKYGSELNPLALIYMMFAIILPSLGITFLMVLSMFSGFSINESVFYVILIFLVVFQFAFLGIVKSRRPFVEI